MARAVNSAGVARYGDGSGPGGEAADSELASGPLATDWLVAPSPLSAAIVGPLCGRGWARRAVRRSALARARSFNFISRSRLINDVRWLLIRLRLLGWKACEAPACAPGGEPHGSAVHGSCSLGIARKSLSLLASRARQCGRPLAGPDFQRPKVRTRSSSGPCSCPLKRRSVRGARSTTVRRCPSCSGPL